MTSILVDTTYLIPGQSIDASDVVIPLIDLEHGIEGMIDGVYKFLKNTQVNATPATLASDAFTAVQTFYAINTQGGANDELRTVTRSGQVDMVVLWKNTADPITITVRNSIGNIILDAGRDVIISDRNTALVLFWNATTSKWNGDLVTFGNIWLNGFPFTQIQSDTISITTPKVGVYAESGLTDNLATINHGVITSQMDVIFLTAVNTYTITLKHNTGNLFFPSGRDVILDSTNDWAMLVWNDVTNKWHGQSSTDLRAQQATEIKGTISPFAKMILPTLSFIRGGGSMPSGGGANPPIMPLYRNRNFLENMVADWMSDPTTFQSIGMTFTTTGTPTAGGDSVSDWVQITSGAVIGNKAMRAGTVGPQLRWSPYFECTYENYGNTAGAIVIDHAGLMGLFNTPPAVTASGITSFAGVSGVGFSYQVQNTGLQQGGFNFILVDNGVVTIVEPSFTTNSIPFDAIPKTPDSAYQGNGLVWFWIDFPNSKAYIRSSQTNVLSTYTISISGALSAVALAPMIFDGARTAVAIGFKYRHMLATWRN